MLVPVSGRASKFPSLAALLRSLAVLLDVHGLKEEPTRARREDEWPEGKWAAYQVKLDMGQFIYAPIDQDKVCKAPPEGMEPAREPEPPQKPPSPLSWEQIGNWDKPPDNPPPEHLPGGARKHPARHGYGY